MNKRTLGVSENWLRTSIPSMPAGKPFSVSFEYDPTRAKQISQTALLQMVCGFPGEQASSFSQKRKVSFSYLSYITRIVSVYGTLIDFL